MIVVAKTIYVRAENVYLHAKHHLIAQVVKVAVPLLKNAFKYLVDLVIIIQIVA